MIGLPTLRSYRNTTSEVTQTSPLPLIFPYLEHSTTEVITPFGHHKTRRNNLHTDVAYYFAVVLTTIHPIQSHLSISAA
jgi:hypothetical protein